MEQNVKRFNKLLRNIVNFEDLGFKSFKINNIDFWWELHRTTSHKTDRIVYGFLKDKWGDDLGFNLISTRIIFESVNKILMSVPNKGSYNFYLSDPTIIRLPNFDLEVDKYVPRFRNLLFVKDRVVNEQVFEESLELFQEQLQTTVLPFFDKIQTLQQVNDEILEKVDWNTYNKYISGEAGAKVLIIMKLCNNPRYEAYKKRSDKLIVEQLNDPKYAQYVDILQNQQIIMDEVYNYLESGKYLEEIA